MANIFPQKLDVWIVGGSADERHVVVADSPIGAARFVLRRCIGRGDRIQKLFVSVCDHNSHEILLDSSTQPEVFDGLH